MTIAATGLPGNPIKGVLFISPKAKGLPGLIANFQKLIFPYDERILPIISVSLLEIPPLETNKSYFDEFFKILFFVSLKLSIITPRSNASHPIILNIEIRVILLASKI